MVTKIQLIKIFCHSQISWLTKQGYNRDYIEEVIASDALNEQPNEIEAKIEHIEDIDKDIKAAQDAAKVIIFFFIITQIKYIGKQFPPKKVARSQIES